MTVLITGAGKGLGKEIGIFLSKKSYPVIGHYRKETSGLDDVIQGNFSTRESISSFCKEVHERKDIRYLIHNVGNYLIEKPSCTSIEQWEELIYPNLLAPMMITNALLPQIINQKGSIVMIGATGLDRADNYSAAYTALKGALLSMTRSYAKELLEKKVAVNMVSPGVLPNSIDMKGSCVPFEEVAKVVCFLLEDESREITGQNIEVAGGLRL
jgi:NAD(P)-dependent dehydrogenase (short-subunit alcohol dehydrogenase family)